MSSSFVDTNVPIAYVFLIGPKNSIAEKILSEEYDNVFCSENVLIEFDDRTLEKRMNLMSFYDKFTLHLSIKNTNKISYSYMLNFADNEEYGDVKEKEDVIESISMFWNHYHPHESIMPKVLMIEYINQLRNELEFGVCDWINFCKEKLINIDEGIHERINQYKNPNDLFDKLYSCGMHDEDIEISLDAHDYSLTLNCQMDFVTFDKKCFKCVSKENLCFNEIRCYKDYEN